MLRSGNLEGLSLREVFAYVHAPSRRQRRSPALEFAPEIFAGALHVNFICESLNS